ncbi:MAG: hypothetical protein EAX95_14255 [Candidatus Thorarchaeota archaeon]|nr:hypothetical protein [Candidatus Thorarchaeota archaeon]
MDPIVFLLVIVAVLVASAFNYFLNRAPGSVPEDYTIGPAEFEIRCDCCLNPLIVGGILVIALAIMSASFDSRTELYIVGFTAFIIVTIAGIYGRRQRHKDWEELDAVLERVVPEPPRQILDYTDFDIDEDDEEDDPL